MTLNYVSIGQHIKHARIKKGLTQEQLAERINASRDHIAHSERGEGGMSLEYLVAISNTLGIPIAELLSADLIDSMKSSMAEMETVMLECTPDEEKIIVRVAKVLRAILYENGI